MEIEIAASGYEPAHYTVVPNSEHVVLSSKNALGDMFNRILVVFLLAVVAQARAAIIKGTIILNEVGGRPIANDKL